MQIRHNLNISKTIILNTFRKIFSSWFCLLMISSCILVDIGIIILYPKFALLNQDQPTITRNDLQQNLPFFLASTWVVLSVLLTFFASASSDATEITLVLSRPMNRNIYLCSKFIAQMSIGIFLWLWYIASWAILRKLGLDRSSIDPGCLYNNRDIISDGIRWSTLIVPMLLLTILSIIVGNTFSLFTKHGIFFLYVLTISLVCLVLIIVIISTTQYVINDTESVNHFFGIISKVSLNTPSIILSCSVLVFGTFGIWKVNRMNIMI